MLSPSWGPKSEDYSILGSMKLYVAEAGAGTSSKALRYYIIVSCGQCSRIVGVPKVRTIVFWGHVGVSLYLETTPYVCTGSNACSKFSEPRNIIRFRG